MKTMLKLLLCLGATLVAHGANLIGEQSFAAPYSVNESVNAVGPLTLLTPGTYSASAWNLVGPLRLAAAGDYTLIATSGSISVTGTLTGPAGARATLHVSYARTFNLIGVTASNVTVVDDTQAQSDVGRATAPLLNLSTRATLASEGALNVGFVIGGNAPQRVLIRAVGPGLVRFGVTDVLPSPRFEVFRGMDRIASNAESASNPEIVTAANAAGAFALEPGSNDAAIVLTLAPGAYTVVVNSAMAGERGEVLAEVYLVP